MKRRITLFALLITFLAWGTPGDAASERLVWSAQTTDATEVIETRDASVAQVTIWAASGSPDGTVTIYKSDSNAPEVKLAEYAKPTSAKCLSGPVGMRLRIALTGMSTGAVGVKVVLK